MTDPNQTTHEILSKRARDLAQRGKVVAREAAGEPVAVLLVGGEMMGIEVSFLQGIVRLPPVTPVPHVPSWIPGVIQVRGVTVSVVDLAKWLGLKLLSESPYLAILRFEDRLLGLAVAGVAGVREFFSDELVEQRVSQRSAKELPLRYRTRDLIAVLDVEQLFALADQRPSREPASSSSTSGAAP